METTTYTLKLGDRTFEIVSPLTFKQLSIIEPSFALIMQQQKTSEVPTDDYYNLIAQAILVSVNDPNFTRAMLNETRMTSPELGNAFKMIAFASGMWREKKDGDVVPGEAPAEMKVNP